MQVLILRNPPAKLKGYISLRLFEIPENVFIGHIPSKEIASIWDLICRSYAFEKGFGALLAQSADNLGKLSLLTVGVMAERVGEIDGVPVILKKNRNNKNTAQSKP